MTSTHRLEAALQDDGDLNPRKCQKIRSNSSDTESDSTVAYHEDAAVSDEMQLKPTPATSSVTVPPELKIEQHVKPAVGEVLQVLLSGTAPPAAMSPEMFSALTAKLTHVLDAADRDNTSSINHGASLAAARLLPQLEKLVEENQNLTAAARQTEELTQRLQAAERKLHAKDRLLRESERALATQVQHTDCYRDMAQTYTSMYLKATRVAQSLQAMSSSQHSSQQGSSAGERGRHSPDWLDAAMAVPIVRLRQPLPIDLPGMDPPGSLAAPAVSRSAAPAVGRSRANDEASVEISSSEIDEEVEKYEDVVPDDTDIVEIMMRDDIRKYGAERTSQRWACHRYIFHHLALEDSKDTAFTPADAEIYPSTDDGRMYA